MNDGGPAFGGDVETVLVDPIDPSGEPIKIKHRVVGMSLRDYFAAKAMQALLSQGGMAWNSELSKREEHDKLAKRAYYVANAMIVAQGESK